MTIVMHPIYTQTVSGTATTVTFNNIPQVYTDLFIKIGARSNVNAVNSEMYINHNSDGTNNYSTTWLTGSGSSAGSARGANNGAVVTIQINGATSTANSFGSVDAYIPRYTQAPFKQVIVDGVIENNATAADLRLIAYLYRSSLPITSTTFTAVGGSFVSGSTFTIYGIINQ
jgi:hypothetical protein